MAQARIAAASEKLGFELRYHSVAQVETARSYLELIYDRQQKTTIRPLRPAEVTWVKNERVLCACDFRYYATRYCFIRDISGEVRRFEPWVSQKIMLDVWGEMEDEGIAINIQQLKARQLGCCLDPDTRILTSDLRWRRIEDIEVGDKVVAVDEGMTPEEQKQDSVLYQRQRRHNLTRARKLFKSPERKLRVAVVEVKREVQESAIRLTIGNRQKLTATSSHRFLCRRSRGSAPKWMTVESLRVGDKIRYVAEPWESESSYEDGWFGGILDGEGSLRVREKVGGLECCMSQCAGTVLESAREYLRKRNYTYHVDPDLRKHSDGSSKLGNNPVFKLVVNRLSELFRLIGQTRPKRFMERNWWVGRGLPRKGISTAWRTITNIEHLAVRRMIDLQTSTKTYIAEGFVSHNSLLTELAVAHRVQFYPDVNALVVSSDPEKSAKMAQMMERAWENMPWFLMPGIKTWRTGTLMEFNNGSIVSIQHGTQKSGLARGDTPTVGHLSELPDYENPGELVDASLLRAMHDTPQKFLILEATAKGIHNWWHDTWNSNKVRWPRRESSLRPVFLPYFVGSDIYPTKTWLKAHPVPPDWKPSAVALKHEERANAYVQVNDLLRKHLGADWRLPRHQLWWWELTREQYKEKNELAQFYSETPADDVDAFQSQCYPAFNAEIIAEYLEGTRQPKAVFGFVGTSVPTRIQPDRREIDSSMPPIPIRKILPNGARFECDLVPLRFSGYPGYDWTNKLFIWEFPEKGGEYGLGVDTGEGVGIDSSVIEVFRKQDFNRRDCQVAEFASPYANSYDMSALVFAVSNLYTLKLEGEPQEPKIVVECNSSGKATQLELRKMGCSNFHMWMGSYDTRKLRASKSTKIGWWTNQWSRDLMKDFFIKRLRDHWVEILSPYFVEEMRDLERNDVRQRIAAMHGGHDDRFMASGFVLFSLHALSLVGTQPGNPWQADPTTSKPQYPLYVQERFVHPCEFEGETPESAYPAESLEVYRGY